MVVDMVTIFIHYIFKLPSIYGILLLDIMNNDLPEYLTLMQVADLLQVHPNTLRNWDKNGTLKAVRIGVRKIRRYKKSDVLKMLDEK